MTDNLVDLVGWCEDNSCGEPIRGALGQKVPRFCLSCTVCRKTGVQAPTKHADDPDELTLGSGDYRQLKELREEDEGNF